MKMVHIAEHEPAPGVWTMAFRQALAALGELEIIADGAGLSDDQKVTRLQAADVAMLSWGASPLPVALANEPGRLRYVCNVTGTLRWLVPPAIIDAGIPVSNWGDTPAQSIAEGAMCLLLATLKDLHAQLERVRGGAWALDPAGSGGTLEGLDVGIYGMGVIGRRFVEMLRPFACVVRAFDPYTHEMPAGVTVVGSLAELFSQSRAIVIHAGLTDATRRSVTAQLLGLLPRHGIIINTARGDIVDQDALFAELASGRLRAGLDVLATPEKLPADHPARRWDNLILTCHQVERGWPTDGQPPQGLAAMHAVCLDNLRRFDAGLPLKFVMDRRRYELST